MTLVVGVIYFALDTPEGKENISYASGLKGDPNAMIETATTTQAPLRCVNRLSLNSRWSEMYQTPVSACGLRTGETGTYRVVRGSLEGNELARQQSLGEKEARILPGGRRRAGFNTAFGCGESSQALLAKSPQRLGRLE